MNNDWSKIFVEFRGKWVAVDAEDETTVLAAAPTPDQAYAKSEESGRPAFLLHVPERLVDFVGHEIRV